MISINSLDYKQELKKIAMQKMVVNAVVAVLVFILTLGAYWGFQKIEIKYRANELENIQNQVRELTSQTTKIQSMKLQNKRITKIIKKINDLRANQFQITQILEDLILPIPKEIWLTSIKQLGLREIKSKQVPMIFIGNPEKIKKNKIKNIKTKNKNEAKQEFLEVRGRLFGKYSDEIIIRYIGQLRKSSRFTKVFLHQTSQQKKGNKEMRDFTFYIYMPAKA